MTIFPLCNPLQSLQEGHWFKLICGASYQYLPGIQYLTLVYAWAGANCIDVAADPAVIRAAQWGLDRFEQDCIGAKESGWRPWLMVSLNDGEDPHFRKAVYDPALCPEDCPRPCAAICPAAAIAPLPQANGGVTEARCYGCGRCWGVCPQGLIGARSFTHNPEDLLPQLMDLGIDALEIHTQIQRQGDFLRLWEVVRPWLSRLKLVAISCPWGAGAVEYLWDLYRAIAPLPCELVWQVDGRPMSGDIGAGTTHATLEFAQALLRHGPPGYVQLAGGTNDTTIAKVRQLGLGRPQGAKLVPLVGSPWVAGAAYGSYARRWVAEAIAPLENLPPSALGSARESTLGSGLGLTRESGRESTLGSARESGLGLTRESGRESALESGRESGLGLTRESGQESTLGSARESGLESTLESRLGLTRESALPSRVDRSMGTPPDAPPLTLPPTLHPLLHQAIAQAATLVHPLKTLAPASPCP